MGKTYKNAKKIMVPLDNRDAWYVENIDDEESYGEIQQSLTCPYCFETLYSWSNDDLTVKMSEHRKNCTINPKNRPKNEPEPEIEKPFKLPIWAY